jgi:hypothetical protein
MPFTYSLCMLPGLSTLHERAKLTRIGTLTFFRPNAFVARELLSCPAAARRGPSPFQLPEREWAHRGLWQRGSSRQW